MYGNVGNDEIVKKMSQLVFFFFQAEDGIRDYKVTGVQTCALPIFVEVSLDRQDSDSLDSFERRAVALDAVQQCWRVSAGPDFILVVAAPDMPAYLELSRALFTGDANVRKDRKSVV